MLDVGGGGDRASAVSTCGTVSSALKPLCTATSRIAVAGSMEQ